MRLGKFSYVLLLSLPGFALNGLPTEVGAQLNTQDAHRYAIYRHRLSHFVQVGYVSPDTAGCYPQTLYGYSLVASNMRRNHAGGFFPQKHVPGDVGGLGFGDPVALQGYYLGMLATEYALAQQKGAVPDSLLFQIFCAIEALDRLDRLAERLPPFENTNCQANGYFVRNDVGYGIVPGAADKYAFWNGRRLSPYAAAQPGIYRTEDCAIGTGAGCSNQMSMDQLVHLFVGFGLVKRYLPNQTFSIKNPGGETLDTAYNPVARMAELTARFLNYLAANDYRVQDPVFNELVSRGNNAQLLAYGLQQCGAFLTGLPAKTWRRGVGKQAISKFLFRSYATVLQPADLVQLGQSFSYSMIMTLAAVGDCWTSGGILGRSNTTATALQRISSQLEGGFFALLHSHLHNRPLKPEVFDTLLATLRTADTVGNRYRVGEFLPKKNYGADHAPPGWRTFNRWISFRAKNGNDWSWGLYYNGLDYLLLHNLLALHPLAQGQPTGVSASLQKMRPALEACPPAH